MRTATEPPTHWVSDFQGSTWTRTTDPDGTPGEWYLHLFAPQQPDVNWSHPDVRAEFEDVLRFWFDRGVGGIRIDSAALLVKDRDAARGARRTPGPGEHPHVDRDEIHDVYRGWRKVADSYPGTRVLVGEVWLADQARFAQYLRPDEMHTAFNFDFMARPWDARELRESIDMTLAAHRPGRRPRHLGAVQPRRHAAGHPLRPRGQLVRLHRQAVRHARPTSTLGLRRARAAALLTAALPGSLYVYQGDELGLPEVEDLPLGPAPGPDALPLRRRRPRPRRLPGAAALVRDRRRRSGSAHAGAPSPGCRSPRPGPGSPSRRRRPTPRSMLALYRDALAVRRAEPGLGDGPMTWLDAPDDVLAFRRGDARVRRQPRRRARRAARARVRPGRQRSRSTGTSLPTDTAVWLRTARSTRPTT